jgi:hypothetical protein
MHPSNVRLGLHVLRPCGPQLRRTNLLAVDTMKGQVVQRDAMQAAVAAGAAGL